MSRRRRQPRMEDEPMGLSGWLYADMFLALVIVGLSTAWITAETPAPVVRPPESTTTTTTTTTLPEEPPQFQLSCDEFFLGPDVLRYGPQLAETVDLAIKWEIRERGLEPGTEARVGLMIVYGGFDGEDVRGGSSRAETFARTLRSDVPALAGIELRAGGGTRSVRTNGVEQAIGGAGRYGAIVYLVFLGDPRPEDVSCSQ